MTTQLKFAVLIEVVENPLCGNVTGSASAATPQAVIALVPVVTLNGTPVTPDSLVIDSAPLHGTLTVTSAMLNYQAAAGYSGNDSFTYHAVVSGFASNEATGTIQINLPVLGKPIQRLHRLLANLYADTEVDCYVRTDNGAMDLSGYQLTAHIHPYQRPQPWGIDYGPGMAGYYVPWETQIAAQQIAVGHVQFLVDHGTVRARLGGGLWRVHLVAVNPTNQQRTRVYTAQLIIQ